LKLVLVEGSVALKSHGVVNVLELNWGDLDTECENVIYILRPEAKATMQVASQISQAAPRNHSFELHFVPKRSFLSEQILRNQGVFDLVRIFEYPLGFIPYDTDVLSLGLDDAFAQVSLQSDDSCLIYSARALLQLQNVLGAIPDIKVKGDHSKKVLDMILRMRLEAEEEKVSHFGESDESDDDSVDFSGLAGDEKELDGLKSDLEFGSGLRRLEGLSGQIDSLLLIDRNIDLVTPLCTALTYESVLDNIIGIRNGHLSVDTDLVDPTAPKKGSKTLLSLNSSDHIYKEIRDMNIEGVLSFLNGKAREIKDNWQDVKGKEVQELYGYVQNRLRSHIIDSQLLPRHINIVNRIRDTTVYDRPFRKMWTVERDILQGGNQLAYIEEAIARQESWTKPIRLACLQSLVQNGIPAAQLDSLRKAIVQTYGYELIFTLNNLERLGMLKPKTSSSTWNGLVSSFKLLPTLGDVSKPEDISYVTSGYAPLSVRVVQLAIRPGWENGKDLLKKLGGRSINKVKQPGIEIAEDSLPRKKKKVMMVFFTGGITFAEIAALRFVAKQEDCPYDILIASTSIMNGKSILKSIAHEMENRLKPF